jgi:DHA1 family bicyclomycin/chloramphenicol resistance-like MFS transporter
MSASLITLLLALFLGIQPVTTDLFLPALPSLAGSLSASMGQTQLTLSALMLCFGVSQLIFGPLSDRFGRRPVLLGGLALYTLAGIGNALAPAIEWLIATRAVQGAAMGAVVMCARAIIRDLYEPAQGARIMAKALGGLGVIACVSPVLGGLLVPLAGWRWALMALAAFGAVTLALVVWRFEESLRRPDPLALQPRQLVAHWRSILSHPTFLSWAALLAASFGGLFTFLAASSFIYIEVYGMSRTMYGLAMGSASLAYIGGTLLCRRLVPRVGMRRAVRLAAWLSLSGGTLMGVLAWAGVHTWWAFVLPHYLFMIGHGIHQPCTQTGAVGPFPDKAGAASAMSGFLLTLVAFGVGGWLGQRLDGTVFPLVNGVWMWSVVIALLSWTVVQRHGDAPAAAPALP